MNGDIITENNMKKNPTVAGRNAEKQDLAKRPKPTTYSKQIVLKSRKETVVEHTPFCPEGNRASLLMHVQYADGCLHRVDVPLDSLLHHGPSASSYVLLYTCGMPGLL